MGYQCTDPNLDEAVPADAVVGRIRSGTSGRVCMSMSRQVVDPKAPVAGSFRRTSLFVVNAH